MQKRWMKLIETLTFVVVIAIYSVLCFIVGTSIRTTPTKTEFPLSEKWVTKLRGNIEHITVEDNNIIIARTASKIYALDYQSGNILWQQSLGWDLLYQPVLAEMGQIFFADGRGLIALRSFGGEHLWQQYLPDPSNVRVADVTPDLIAVENSSYLGVFRTNDGSLLWKEWVCRGSFQAYFYDANVVVPCYGLAARDAISGEIVWEIKSETGLNRIWRSAYADGVIYFSQDLKYITAYDVKNRRQLWKRLWANDRSQAFRVSGDYLLAMKDDQLCILHRSDGEISWCADNLVRAKDPVIFGDVVYLFYGFQDGITAFDVRDGSKTGRLDFNATTLIAVDYHTQLMIPSDEFLIFANKNRINAYGK
jgi:outer membrane protein assembly factor BamB